MRSRNYSVFTRKGRPVWYVKYVSTTTLDWVSEATAYRLDDPAGERKAVKYAEGLVQKFAKLGGVTKNEAWSAWVDNFLRNRYAGPDHALTLKAYLNSWSFCSTFLQANRIVAPFQLNYNHADAFITWRTGLKRQCGKPISKNTALCNLRCLSLVMQEAVRRGYALANPLLRTGIKKVPAKEKVELLPSEVATIREAVAKKEAHLPLEQRWMTVSFEIAYYQGCRLKETQVLLSDVNETRGEITFHAKGHKTHPTALHPALKPLMAQLRAAGALAACSLPKMAAKEWWALRQELKLSHTCFHSTRVGVVSQLARAGVSEQQAMRFVGHSSRLVHQVYQKLRVEDLGACLTALSARPEKPA